jgi:hypothetical protein
VSRGISLQLYSELQHQPPRTLPTNVWN